MTITFTSTDGPGVEVFDSIEGRRCLLRTSEPVDPVRERSSPFDVPIDEAVSVTTDQVEFEPLVDAYIRNDAGEVVATARPATVRELSGEVWTVELSGPIKLYLRARGPGRMLTDLEGVRIAFDDPTTVVIGARSYHSSPAATITTTREPEDLLRAVSAFGSALKTTACERSFPTLRGHPPALERGEALDIPDGLEPPDTGTRIEVPATLASAFAVAPLAYYLGATVRPGARPRLLTDSGFVHEFDAERQDAAFARLLKHVFVLDCLTRSEGAHQLALHERRVVESRVGVDFEALYDERPASQLEAYLSVPYGAVDEHVPTWNLTAYVDPAVAPVEALPFLVDDLAVVRTRRGPRHPSPAFEPVGTASPRAAAGSRTRSTETVSLPASDSVDRVWFGHGVPPGATKGVVRAFQNRLDHESDDSPIEIAVVCNDLTMREELSKVTDIYGSREDLPFDVAVHTQLSTGELESVFAADLDFLHYIGHADDGGFRCRDGTLDPANVAAGSPSVFLLNACRSYRAGLALVENGSVGGIVTVSDVIDGSAVRMGYSIARLLELGFPLRAALLVARRESVFADEYTVVGDGTVDVAQERTTVPTLCTVSEGPSREFEVTVQAYLTRDGGMGTVVYPHVPDVEEYYLPPGTLATFPLSPEALVEFLEGCRMAVSVDGRLVWDAEEWPFREASHG